MAQCCMQALPGMAEEQQPSHPLPELCNCFCRWPTPQESAERGAAPQPFFEAMHRALKPGGVICTQVW